MSNFLEQSITDLYNRFNGNLSNVLIIIPGKRPKLFIQQILSKITSNVLVTPDILTIGEFMEQKSGLLKSETINSVTILYNLYKEYFKNTNLEQFWFFGEMILSDFSDIDKYMVDSDDIFKYVKSLKEIDELFIDDAADEIQYKKIIREFWQTLLKGSEEEDRGEIRTQFIQLWEVLSPLYKKFNTALRENGVGYEGMIYRDVANKAQQNNLDFDNKVPVFIGFNALSKAENIIFKYAKSKNALYYWDYDNYYVNNSANEAGYFLRNNLNEFPSAINNIEKFNNLNQKDINVIGCAGEVEMVSLVVDEISNINDVKNSLDIGVVLANESLLLTFLQCIPKNYSFPLNITMGLPFNSTSINSFIQLLLDITKKRTVIDNIVYYETQWIIDILQQPLIDKLFSKELIKELVSNNSLYTNSEYFSQNAELETLFPTNLIGIIDYLLKVYSLLYSLLTTSENTHQLNIEAIGVAQKSLNQLQIQIVENKKLFSEPLITRLYRRILSGITITLEGEPLKGVQIMGIIESRLLDFNNLFLVGVNEGFLPASSVAPSFIPYNIRNTYGLLTYEHQDSIYAYFFYRLLQRSENINLIYNTEINMDYGEISRFIKQLDFEYDKSLNFRIFSNNLVKNIKSNIVVEKTKSVMQLVSDKMFSDKGNSPTALNTYLDCKLKFYFQYIKAIKIPDKLEVTVDYRLFGNLFHDTMEMLYRPYIDNVVNEDLLIKIGQDSNVNSAIKHAFDKNFPGLKLPKSQKGQFIIVENIIGKYVKKTLAIDKKRVPFTIVGVESKFSYNLNLPDNKIVKLTGKVDRLDEVDKKLQVIDYKTGSAKSGPIKFELLCENNPKRVGEGFQILTYALILSEIYNIDIYPILFFVQTDNQYTTNHFGSKFIFNEKFDEFKNSLINVCSEILNPDIPFEANLYEDKCANCNYKEICGR